jgi:Outer membrane protein beta-barrel domain
MNFDNSLVSYSQAGYQGGFFLRKKLNKIGFQPEVLLSWQKTLKKNSADRIEDSFVYLNIPIMFKYYPIERLNIQLGPQFGFLVGGERNFSSLRTPLFFNEDLKIKDAYKNSDVSISVGGGYDFKFGLELDLRCNVGINDINNVANGASIQSRVIVVSLGWSFLKK